MIYRYGLMLLRVHYTRNFLCKIEQLNSLNKSEDRTLIAILLPASLRRAIGRHLEKCFRREHLSQSCVHIRSRALGCDTGAPAFLGIPGGAEKP